MSRRRNPDAEAHLSNAFAFLESAESELDASKTAFETGNMDSGWEHYLDAFREIARAQQELLYGQDSDDDAVLDMLEIANVQINKLDTLVRHGLRLRLGAAVPLETLFEFEAPTSLLARSDVVHVPLADWQNMRGHIAVAALHHYGTIRRASAALGIPRATLGAWSREAPV